jgi:ribosomal protein S18 acetylase RimI-like enzyme
MYIVKDEFSPAIFAQIASIWTASGVGNPARGDNYEVVSNTIAHGAKILTLWHEEEIIGTVWLTHDFRRLYIHHMAMRPDWLGKKLSHLLLEKAMAYAIELGYHAKLEVERNNLCAKHLYEKYGFQNLGDFLVLINRNPANYISILKKH